MSSAAVPESSAVPAMIRLAAAALGVTAEPLSSLGGATGATWACGPDVLRVGTVDGIRRELVAMRAAGRVVPVPDVLARADFTDERGRAGTALLISRLPGRTAGDLAGGTPERIRRWGEACGRLHATLAAVPPPPELPGPPGFPDSPAGGPVGLLHLDLHPFNVLIDDHGEVGGVLDWSLASAGPAVLDRARTWSILTLDPAVLPFRQVPVYMALRDGWADTAGFARLPAAARAWACRFMLNDLGRRYPADRLDHVRRYLAEVSDEER